MKFRILFTIVISFIFSGTYAQMLKGRVFDASTNVPLSGATISNAGKGATTDNNGMFQIECRKASVITISFIGYQTQRISVRNCNEPLSVALISSTQNLNTIEITATSVQNKSILSQPSSITKVTTPELKRSTGLFLDDAINTNVPGVIMQRRAVSSGQTFNIRGYGSGGGGTGRVSSNFDIQGTKVYLNGIPVTDAEGITVMDDIDFGSVGNVEITKGPSGTLYGLAIAGVVNLNTITPEKGKTSIGEEVMIGDYGLQRYTTHFTRGAEHSSILINYGHQKINGYTIHNASKKDFINVAANFTPTDKESVNTYFGYSHSYDERSGELTIAQYNANDFSGNPEYIKRNGHSEITSFRAGATNTFNFSKNISNSTTVFGSGVTNNSSSAAGWTDKDPINYGFRSSFNTKFSPCNDLSLSGITGMEAQRQNAQTIGYTMVKNPADPNSAWTYGSSPYYIIGAATSNKFTTSGTASYFTEWTLAFPKNFSITAGIGYSTMNIHLNDRFYVANSTLPTTFDTSYKNMFSPHLAINKIFSQQFSVYAAYSKGYKAPTSSYFYIPATGAIVKGLKPEVGDQFEIGTKGVLLNNRLFYQIDLFDAIFSNKMTAINVLNAAGTSTLYTYVANGGKQDDKGIEALLKWNVYQSTGFIKGITPFANITYSDFKYKDYRFHYKGTIQKDSVVNYDGKNVAGVSKVVANIGFDVTTKPGVYANMTYFYKDPFPITSDNLNNTSAYHLLNSKLGYQQNLSLHFDLNVYIGVNNITGTKYPIAVFVNQLPDTYLVGPVKANFYGGVDLKYNF